MNKRQSGHASVGRSNFKRCAVATLILAVAGMTGSTWTGLAWAQTNVKRVGILSLFGRSDDATWDRLWMQPLHRKLAAQGWAEGKNVVFEYRTAQGDPSQFSKAAKELVDLGVDVIMAESAPATRAAFTATRTIPIVAIDLTTDPISEGYIESYGQPGGNLTGVFLDAPEFAGKWFELLNEIIPHLSRVAVLWDPAPGSAHLRAVRSVAGSLNVKVQVLEVRKAADFGTAFSAITEGTQAVIILPSPTTYWQNPRLAELGLKHRLPATSMALEFAAAGGAIAYGPDRRTFVDRLAVLVAKILEGTKPAELPVERPTKVQLIVNLKTTKKLGIHVPQSILLRADEVIE